MCFWAVVKCDVHRLASAKSTEWQLCITVDAANCPTPQVGLCRGERGWNRADSGLNGKGGWGMEEGGWGLSNPNPLPRPNLPSGVQVDLCQQNHQADMGLC